MAMNETTDSTAMTRAFHVWMLDVARLDKAHEVGIAKLAFEDGWAAAFAWIREGRTPLARDALNAAIRRTENGQ